MVNAIRSEELDRVAHAVGPARLARVNRPFESRFARFTKRLCEARAGPACRHFVAINRKCDRARQAHSNELLNDFDRLLGRLVAQ